MDNKKFILGVAVFVGVLALGLILLIVGGRGPNQAELEEIKKTVIKDPVLTGNGGDVLVNDDESFQIVYLMGPDSFLISVLGSPFEEVRKDAEQEFLRRVGGDTEIACALSVVVNTPAWANEEFSGRNFRLSFCDGGSL